jgi:vancomycin resistance protein VanJ
MGHKQRQVLPVLTLFNIAVLLALWILESFVAERHWLTTLLTYAPQHGVGIPSTILIVWAAYRREWRAIACNAIALVFFALYFLGLNVPLTSTRTPTGTPLRVMTYNILHGAKGAKHIAEIVNREQPDVLCLQEANASTQWRDLVPELQRLLPGWHMTRYGELVTFSRHPIVSQRIHRLPTRVGAGLLETKVDVKEKQLTVFNVHISIPVAGPAGLRPASLQARAAVRTEQLGVLLHAADAVNSSFIIMGDFNTPPRGHLYRRLSSRFHDAFHSAGPVLGYTYSNTLPVLRIDHIFMGPAVTAHGWYVPEVSASDHRPVVADLVLNGSSEDNELSMQQ